MPHLPTTSLTRTATRMALASLLMVALLPPMLWFGGGLAFEHGRARAAAAALAWMDVSAAAGTLRDAWDPVVASGLPADAVRVRWTGGAGGPLSEHAGLAAMAPVAWPAIEVRAARAAGASGGAVIVERSLRPLLGQTLWIGLLSGALALAGWLFGLNRSVSLMARAENRMRALASLDPLTGLLNRDGLRRRLQRALARRRGRRSAVAVLMIDMDRFGLINDTLGQSSGDDLLRAVANRIRSVTRAGDGLARVGGDQFAVHVETGAGRGALDAMARNLQRAFVAPFQLEGRNVVVSFSIGMVLAPSADVSVDTLLHQAAQAVRAAKKQGGNRVVHHETSAGESDDAGHRLDLEQRLHGALGAGQFFAVYQPIVDAASETVTMVEALLRWRDPQRGVVSPAEFIPALEQTGLIVPVGRWILREACLQIAGGSEQGPDGRPIAVSVNLSPLQFAEPDFLHMVTSVLRETRLAPERLQLEVTEGLLLDPTPETLLKIDGLVGLGVKLAVDDFGMGYSSLIYLKRFKLHTLKIDRMFVRDITHQAQDLTIVRAIIDLGHGLGMRVTAEGVETREQSDALRSLGCDALQGYLYGRPELPRAVASAAPAARALDLPRRGSAEAAAAQPA